MQRDLNARVMILEDDKYLANQMRKIIESYGYKVRVFHESTSFINEYQDFNPDVVLLDIHLVGSPHDGIWVMRHLCNDFDTTSKIIVISGEASTLQVDEIRRLGAYTFMEKGANFNLNQLLLNVENGVQLRRQESENLHLQIENLNLKKQLIKRYPFIGECNLIREARQKLEKFAKADEDILIFGETGTGKEIAAHYYYQLSPRFAKTFHTINCSALTETLIESELFGHVKGAFTGADRNKIGFFEKCDKGILFLDEISNLSLISQAKILRAIEYNEIQVVGGATRKVDTRLIFASNEKLESLINDGKFRQDLFYRVEGNVIILPPLRDRGEDILLLMQFFLEMYSQKYPIPSNLDLHAIKGDLLKYPWPGNIRELRNFCKHIMINESQLDNKVISKYMALKSSNYRANSSDQVQKYLDLESIKDSVAAFEKDYLIYHLQKNDWKINETATNVGLERTTLYKKMKQYNISKDEMKNSIRR
ncbi:MAG TPA: sigma-54 dependent transcriptional regulator [Candidatus Cloacimonadota bacterium]|nr:sigma-54 dependent transcriptional regulator [Candidatus Cloacimonadota bacterium]